MKKRFFISWMALLTLCPLLSAAEHEQDPTKKYVTHGELLALFRDVEDVREKAKKNGEAIEKLGKGLREIAASLAWQESEEVRVLTEQRAQALEALKGLQATTDELRTEIRRRLEDFGKELALLRAVQPPENSGGYVLIE